MVPPLLHFLHSWTLRGLFCLLLIPALGWEQLAAEDLLIQSGRQTRRVRSRSHEGQPYYRVREITEPFGLSLETEGNRLTVSGPRGKLELTSGRPLVKFQEQYILMSSETWVRSRGDWWVPEDFLRKAIPLVLESRLERDRQGRYRIDALDENEVSVEVVNYPDHVSLVFLPGKNSAIHVEEFSRFIKVRFEEFRVVPRMPAIKPDGAMVADIRFNRGDVFGSFEIVKGPEYDNFREYSLQNPSRKVVGIYGAPLSVNLNDPASPSRPTGPVGPIVARPEPVIDEDVAREYRPTRPVNAITIDPGHGGENYGVRPTTEFLEKNFSWSLAEKLLAELKEGRYRPLLTRNRDINLSAERRSALGNYNRSKVFVSLHVGGSPSPELSGPVVYIQQSIDEPLGNSRMVPWHLGQQRYLEESRTLARLVQARLNQLFGTSNQVQEAPIEVLAPVTAPAILVEAGFLSNPADRRRLSEEEFQTRISRAIAQAIEEFLQ